MKKIAFIAKTNLNNDGRILNELKILKNKYGDSLWIDFILMPDNPLTICVKEVDRFHILDTSIRNSRLFRFFTVFEFTIKALLKLLKLKPDLVHAQNTAITLPVYLYRLIRGTSVKIIYDDHELPNENESLQLKLLQYFESRLMSKADYVVFANAERQDYLEQMRSPKLINSTYILNLPYFEENNAEVAKEATPVLKFKQENGIKFIMHQGIIEVERGRTQLAEFSKLLPENVRILIVGVTDEFFDRFIKEYHLDANRFYFVGLVPYFLLNEYWKIVDASIVMYLPKYLNNRLCAPNRLYISFNNALPIIVNKDNPVLSNFVVQNKCGIFLEDITDQNFNNIFEIDYTSEKMENLKRSEAQKLEDVYKNVLFS